MPYRPKKRIQRKSEMGLTHAQVTRLINGVNILDCDKDCFPSGTDLRKVWKKNKQSIMALQGKLVDHNEIFEMQRGSIYFEYGTRPWGWWQFDAPEPLRLLRVEPPSQEPEGCPVWARIPTEVYESEVAYLERHGLLTKAEKAFSERNGQRRK